MSTKTITLEDLEKELSEFLISKEVEETVINQIKETFLNIFNKEIIATLWNKAGVVTDTNHGKEIYNYVKYNKLKSTKKILDNFIKNIQKDKYINIEDKGDIITKLKENIFVKNILLNYVLFFNIYIICPDNKCYPKTEIRSIKFDFSLKIQESYHDSKDFKVDFGTDIQFKDFARKSLNNLKELLETMAQAQCQYKQYIE